MELEKVEKMAYPVWPALVGLAVDGALGGLLMSTGLEKTLSDGTAEGRGVLGAAVGVGMGATVGLDMTVEE